MKKNRNIVLIKDIDSLKDEMKFDDFKYKKYFSHLCDLNPNKEKLEIIDVGNKQIKKNGLVYILVIEDKIFKIGHTITSIFKRIQSYNCGKIEYRINGTNSTTNYFVLQSFLALNIIVKVYGHFPEQPKYNVFGKEYQDSFQSSKRAEKVILESMDKKPIGCTQR